MDITDNSPQCPLDQPPPARLETFVDIAKWQAERIAEHTGFTFLNPGEDASQSINYQMLDQRIRAVAAVLAQNGDLGQRVLIVQQPGIEYITSLFACMYAGMVAVPVYPLDVFRLRHTLPRLQAITRDADAPIMLTSGASIGGGTSGSNDPIDSRSPAGPLWELCRQAVIFTDEVDSSMAADYRHVNVTSDDLAILQYTSGTTDKPRGVALRHRHLLANAQQIYREYHVPDAVCVFWLPPYHDMGLVGGLLLPMFAGRHSVLMSPTSFVQQPLAWLQAISHYRGTTTASPNFGYELCLKKVADDALQSLDLTSLRVAISGAEPIRATTMRRFSTRFAACGFRSSAFTPAYGMAEATLAITGKPLEHQPVAMQFCADSLHGPEHHALPVESLANAQSVEIVSCGMPLDRTEIRIVDTETLRPVDDQTVGEIWVRGPSVADHYWGKPELSAATFQACLTPDADQDSQAPADTKPFLRTGDLGFIYHGELFVSGRLKDLIIIAGRNFFAHELEAAIQSAHEALKVDGGAAFSVTSGESGEERLVIVQEILRPKKFSQAELIEIIRTTLAEQFDLSPVAVVLVVAGSLSKTSSGKLQRALCRTQFIAGELQILSQWNAASGTHAGDSNHPSESNNKDTSSNGLPATNATTDPITAAVAEIWCEVLEVNQAENTQHFLDLGGHSLAATSLLARIRDRIGVVVDFDTLFRAPRFGQLVDQVQRLAITSPQPVQDRSAELTSTQPITPNDCLPLTATQNRFWLLDQLDFRQAFLYVETTFAIDGKVDLNRLSATIASLPKYHDALRLRFDVDDSAEPFQRLVDQAEIEVTLHDLRTPTPPNESTIRSRIDHIRSSITNARFDLKTGPLFRAALIRVTDDKTLVALAGHHIICDGTSMAILVNEIATRYNETEHRIDQASHSFVQHLLADDKAYRSNQNTSDNLDNGVAYWVDRLRDAPHDSKLSVPPPEPQRPGVGSGHHAPSQTCDTKLSPEATELLHARCREWQVTPFELILAAWHATLARYSQNEEMVLGVPIAGRDRCQLESIVGCFINTLPVRLRGLGDNSFASMVTAVSDAWRSDLQHANVPLDAIIQGLAIDRTIDRLPLIQHLLLHQPPVPQSLSFGAAKCNDFKSAYSTLGAYDTALVCQWHSVPSSTTQGLKSKLAVVDFTLAHSPNTLDQQTAEYLLEGFVELLCAGLRTPEIESSTLPIAGPKLRAFLDPICQSERSHRNAITVLDLFHQRLKQSPDQVVIIDSAGSMTFEQLDQQSTQLAHALCRRGVTPQSIVALRLARSRRITTAALAVWKTGAAYLPLDPAYPEQRLADILDDAKPHCVLTDNEFDALISEAPQSGAAHPLPSVTSDQLAYLIYTSGSTGKPKGVMIGHDNLANVLQAFSTGYGLNPGQRILASTTMSFDISILELFLPLVIGATSVIASHSLSEDPDDILHWLAEHPIDVLQATPSSIRMMLSAGWQPRAGQTVWCGGEPMQIDLATALTDAGINLWNVYGPTETTVWSLTSQISGPVGKPISIGRPIDSTTIRIVDAVGRDCPVGVAGELWIGGGGVGRGYWNRNELTDDRFVDTPSRGRMYRTGDQVRVRSCGSVEFLGRSDRQVKIRGHRVELGEIESVLNRSDGVAEAAVALIDVTPGDSRLIGFFRPSGKSPVDPQSAMTTTTERLKQQLAAELPTHMIPASLIPLSEIPHTPAGKIDYKRLPLESCLTNLMLQDNSTTGRPEPVLPRTETESAIAKIWAEVLGMTDVSVHESFFHLGGHSLMAAQVFARIRVRLGIQLPLREIYNHPTIAGLATLVDDSRGQQTGANTDTEIVAVDPVADRDSLAAYMHRKATMGAQNTNHPSTHGSQPLSPAEQRLWFVDQLEPNHPFYNLPLAAIVQGPLNTDYFWQSVQDCIARHETLRSTYDVVDGIPLRRVHQSLIVVPESIDLRSHTNPSDVLNAQIAAHSRRPFDLAQGPLMRIIHWQLSDQRHAILIVMHHIISDGWSMSVMMRELAEFYRARVESTVPNLTALSVTYTDYAAWQHDYLTPQRIEPTLDFWKNRLSGSIETLDLPTDFSRPAEQDFEGATRPIHLSGELSVRLTRLADSLQVTPFSILLAAYGLLLSRLSGQRDLTVGTAVANRTEPAIEDLIGFFVNTVVVRQQSEGTESFAHWVRKVHEVASEAIEHQEVAFEQVVARLAKQRDRSHSPLFQAAFVLQNTPDALVAAEGLTILPIAVDNGTTKYDLTLFLSEIGGMFAGHFEYRSSLFRPETIDRFISSFVLLLQAGIESAEQSLQLGDDTAVTIDDLPVLSDDTQSQILTRNVRDVVDKQWIDSTIHDLFVRSVALNPNSPAIRHRDRELTYQQFDNRVQQIARGLQVNGVGPGDRVLVYLPRSIDQVACLLAVMRCGAAFAPVDTQFPINRVVQIAKDLAPKFIIGDESFFSNDREMVPTVASFKTAEELASSDDGQWQSVQVDPHDLAYLIFTSGSTGTPKGVAVEHRSICNFTQGFIESIDLTPAMRCAYLFSPSFDGALGDVFPPLAVGGAIEVIDQDLVLDPSRLADFLTRRDVAMVALTPATLAMIQPTDLPKVQRLLSAGAALKGELAAKWTRSHRLHNGYGPTECAVGASIRRLTEDDLPVPSTGRPLPNTRIYVLDSKLRPVPDGVIGEVYIGGMGVARGYWRREDLTQKSFIPDPFITPTTTDTPRMYRTGDLGRWNRLGNLEIVGRCDDQIKLRGFRIEPGEISAVLDGLPGVQQSAVIAWGEDLATDRSIAEGGHADGAGKRLVAYIVPEHSNDLVSDQEGALDSDPNPRSVVGKSQSASDQDAEREHIDNWRHLFDQTQRNSPVVFDPENDFSLWTSVITGRAIATDEMRSWAEATASRIKRLKPRNVLEIGCGTGLILLRIGDAIQTYHGIDVLQSAIDELHNTLSSRTELASKVTLDCRTADRLNDLPEGTFDTIVLNSVVQYFPSEEYLIRVLQSAERLLAPGGRIFLGDLRNLRLHSPFAIAAELYKCDDKSISVGQFRARVRSRIEHDEELLVDPELISNLSGHLDRLRGSTTELKTAIGDNELNRFRYDAVLWFDESPQVDSSHKPLIVCNANVHREVIIDRMLADADDSQSLSELLAEADAITLNAFKPSTIRAAAIDAGWDLRIDWHPECDDAMQVSLGPASGIAIAADGETQQVDWQTLRRKLGLIEHELGALNRPSLPRQFTNRPLQHRRSLQLIQTLRKELQSRLPSYMVPSAFVIVDRLPLTIQGKLDRNALPPPPTQRQSSSPSEAPPVTATQKTLVQIWEELLEVSPIGIDDDFFDLGGHSMLAVRMVTQVQQRTGQTLPLSALFRKPTVEQLADLLDHSQSSENSLVVPLSLGGADEPIFCIHPAGGTVFCYRELAQYFAGQRVVYGIQARGLDGRQSPHSTLQEMAADYADAIVAAVPSGPIHLVGWSIGGNIAYEVARQLRAIGRRVGMLALLDSGMLAAESQVTEDDFLPLIAALFPGQDHESIEELRQKPPGEQLAYFINQAAKAGIVPDDEALVGPHVFDVFQANVKAVHDYQPSEYAGRVLLIRPADQIRTSALFDDQCLGWSQMVGSIELASVSGDHAHMLQQPAVSEIANLLSRYLIANKTDTTNASIYPNVSQSNIDSDVTYLMDANQT